MARRIPQNRLIAGGVDLPAGWRDLVVVEGGAGPRPIDPHLIVPTTSAGLYGEPLGSEPGDVRVDLVRPDDLVQLSVLVRGARLLKADGEEPAHVVVTGDDEALMVVGFPYQHAHERAFFEQQGPKVDPDRPQDAKPVPTPPATGFPLAVVPSISPPVDYRPARGSRIAFRLPAGTEFPLTTAGVLDAMRRLEPIVSERAVPALPDRAGPRVDVSPGRSVLIGDLVATLDVGGVTVQRATAPVRALLRKAVTTPAGAARAAEVLRQLRARATVGDVVAGEGVAAAAVRDGFGIVIGPKIPPDWFLPRAQVFGTPPAAGETSIEAPFRLVISPSGLGRWSHAVVPVPADDDPGSVELWHTRLGTVAGDGGSISERRDDPQRIVRALWARDRDPLPPDAWQDPQADRAANGPLRTPPAGQEDPSLGSLDRADRHRLVRQTSERWRLGPRALSDPEPVRVDRLWLSPLGAWLDLHGRWDTAPYSHSSMASVLSWDHIAPQGRDQYVRVTYPGYLYPTGHKAVLVKVTERKIRPATTPTAGLYQRMFIVVTEPVKHYPGTSGLPFEQIELAPVVTPDLAQPSASPAPERPDAYFWVRLSKTVPFRFTIRGVDRDGYPVATDAPLMWVAESWGVPQAERDELDAFYLQKQFNEWRTLPMKGAQVAFARRTDKGDARLATTSVLLRGHATANAADDPTMTSAVVTVPAAQRLTGAGPLRITYEADYRAADLAAVAEPPAVWAATVLPAVESDPAYGAHLFDADRGASTLPALAFGPTPAAPGQADTAAKTDVGSDAGGGFVQPNLAMRGLSTAEGIVGDVASAKTASFDPVEALQGILPRLFGLVDLIDLLPHELIDEIPQVVTETLGKALQFAGDVAALAEQAQELVAQAQHAVDTAGQVVAEYEQKLEDAAAAAEAARDKVVDIAEKIADVFSSLATLSGDQVRAKLEALDLDTTLTLALDELERASAGMPPLVKGRIAQLVAALRPVVADVTKVEALVKDAVDTVEGVAALAKDMRFRYAWQPPMHSWRPVSGDPRPTLDFGEPEGQTAHPLTIAIEGRMPSGGDAHVEVLAELRGFALNLVPSAQLIRIPFEHIAFRGSSSGKSDVDVVLGEIEFLGILEFINTLKDLIPFDGFSDPPYLDVSAEGIKAGYSLALPNLAVGVFNLSNISLGADVRVPFLGNIVTVGFNFCTREKPLVLSVMFLGGGGFFGLRLSPERVELLELSLEAGAYLAVDFGVASGSISAAVGVYIRMEADKASLTGYVRLRGEVDVLGIISASIELYLELTYIPDTGKMFGRAVITVTIEVFVFSGTVQIEAERQFAGSNGDPSWADMYLASNGTAPEWDRYLDAFATEEVPA